MAKGLTGVLDELYYALRANKSYDVRFYFADRFTHSFKLDGDALYNAIIAELRKRGFRITKALEGLVLKEVKNTIPIIEKAIYNYGRRAKKVQVTQIAWGNKPEFVFSAVDPWANTNVFETIKEAQKSSLDSLADRIYNSSLIKNRKVGVKPGGTNDPLNRNALGLDLGHEEPGTILNLSINKAFEEARKNIAGVDWNAMSQTIRHYQQYHAIFNKIDLVRDWKTGGITVKWEPRAANRSEGGRLSHLTRHLLDAVEYILVQKNDILEYKGSPSGYDIWENKVEFTVLDPFRKLKNVKTTPTSTKKAKGRNRTVKKTYTTKPLNTKTYKTKRSLKTGRFITEEQARDQQADILRNPVRLIASLNARLPQVVAGNMGTPKLNYQTGRFAWSTKITDIKPTPQGAMSIGYTYQLSPYQVFEPGRGSLPWATTDRDPRRLIDESIRELMAQYATDKFFTRRTTG